MYRYKITHTLAGFGGFVLGNQPIFITHGKHCNNAVAAESFVILIFN
jgi:hypothetical protein